MEDVRIFKPSKQRKIMHIIGLSINSAHFVLSIVYFTFALFAFLGLGIFVALFTEEIDGFLDAVMYTAYYAIPNMILLIMSIISFIFCLRYGYKKVLESITWILSIIICIADIVLAVIHYDFLGPFAIGSIIFSIISIIVFGVAFMLCLLDKKISG